MDAQTDQQLLQAYAGSHSDAAFTELVHRHIDLVYSAALRMVRDSHLAEDVAQGVFVALAQNAGQLAPHPVLSGWLHRTTQNLAANTVRTNVRRQTREQEAAAMNELLSAAPDGNWEHIAPHLDAALGELSEPDRDALLLRYFEHKSAREMAQTLGISDEAAQKRVSRAVERLREFLTKRGVSIGAGGLVVVISANAVQAAPVGLAVSICTASLASAASGSATLTILKFMSMTKLKLGIIGAILVAALATPLAIQHHAQVNLREENHSLRQQLDRLAQLAVENARLSNQLAQADSAKSLANEQTGELLKLRAEVQSLRRQNVELALAGTEAKNAQSKALSRGIETNFDSVLNAPTVPLTPAASWANVGNATPNAAFETLYWAMAQRDLSTFSQTLAWDSTARAKAEALFAEAPESVRQRFGSIDGVVFALLSRVSPISGFAVVSENIEGEGGTLLEQHQYVDGRVRQNQVTVQHLGDGWRIVLGDEKLMRGFDAALKRAASANSQP